MVARDRLDVDEIPDIFRRIRRLECGANLGFASITRGSLRVASNEGLIVEGSMKVSGFSIITGTERVIGLLEVLGDLVASGTISLTGPTDITGAVDITGDMHIDGTTELTKTLTVNSPGKIIVAGGASPLTLESGEMSFGTGGAIDADTTNSGIRMTAGTRRVYVGTGAVAMQYDATRYVQVNSTGTHVVGVLWADGGLQTTGSKSFIMDHPTKADHWLRHGSTESPVSGIEYWGEVELDENGAAIAELPDYFEALAKPGGRTVFVTGRGFSPDWTDIEGNQFTITGAPGKKASWLVKAERFGGDFLTEEAQPAWAASSSS
ncbi:MAG: hypothetical protein ABWY57_16040 [Mycetocola sp.]